MTPEQSAARGGAGARTRERIVDAAARVMERDGLVRATTKEIAREAGCSEAALYKYFRDKTDIFVHVLTERLPRLAGLLRALPERAGTATVEEHLVETVRTALRFYRRSVPMAASLYAQPKLLAAHRDQLRGSGDGPQKPAEWLAGYLRTEQRLGRIDPSADPEAAAALLIGSAYQRAFLSSFLTDPAEPEAPADLGGLGEAGDAEYARKIVRTLLDGLTGSSA
ncbi:TetR/AcrR family transcriptional regulator [Phaeacidiphilus oryzae]|jgi:AcrR family transcriptional regulator|uniref:TetR/AcrR family transcriptional regulator n=1 Tax=Phaeacidiphilus oryzae TaxID=348818 RepID=UPI00055AF3DF|nr:TetR/AcrR family transcriptional regulator [Phaeacidiphilus oryzae]